MSLEKKKFWKPQSAVLEMTGIQSGDGLGCGGVRNRQSILAGGLRTCKILGAAKSWDCIRK